MVHLIVQVRLSEVSGRDIYLIGSRPSLETYVSMSRRLTCIVRPQPTFGRGKDGKLSSKLCEIQSMGRCMYRHVILHTDSAAGLYQSPTGPCMSGPTCLTRDNSGMPIRFRSVILHEQHVDPSPRNLVPAPPADVSEA